MVLVQGDSFHFVCIAWYNATGLSLLDLSFLKTLPFRLPFVPCCSYSYPWLCNYNTIISTLRHRRFSSDTHANTYKHSASEHTFHPIAYPPGQFNTFTLFPLPSLTQIHLSETEPVNYLHTTIHGPPFPRFLLNLVVFPLPPACHTTKN